MTSANDGKDLKSNQNTVTKGKSFYIELYKSLEAGLSKDCDLSERTQNLCEAWRRIHSLCSHSASSTHPHLLSWLQRHTARTVLLTEWQDPENKTEHKHLEEAINEFITESRLNKDGDPPWQVQLVARGEWFRKILANPWGHPVLRVLLDPKRKESPNDEEVLEWLKEERGVMFVTRLRQLASSKHCNDLALELASSILNRVRACMDLPKDEESTKVDEPKEKQRNVGKSTFLDTLKAEAGFTVDVIELLTDIEFVLLHKRDNVTRCIELAKQTPLRNGYQLVERLQSRQDASPREKKLWKNAKDVATLIAQVVIARCMVVSVCSGVSRTALYCCARSLARLLGAARLATAAAALAAPAATSRHLHTLALAVDSESKDDMKPFVCELYVRAITAGMNELERLKLNAEKESEARLAEQILSQWFIQLGAVLAASERMRCECTLTAFSVHPSPAMFEKIKAAPDLAPVAVDIEPKGETTTSEFGSWANDSRSQTNLVKTSETLKLKHTQHQANVLSTAILTEGEALHLSPELCQDIAVLLSGPRVKTLSWDTDRQLLLENCRTYMERTQGGTRALTTELKYLNLDLRQYQHLPEEEEDDSDVYYGIEKGYEHLVEFQEPEEIWEDAERTESTNSTDIEEIISKVKRKSKKNCIYSEDEDPLSTVAEAKRVLKKKERPHSKERSKVTKSKIKTKIQDPLDIHEQNIEQNVDYKINGTPNTERQIDPSVEKKMIDSNFINKNHDMNVTKDKDQTNQRKKNHKTERKKGHSTERKKDHSTERKKDHSTERKKDHSTERKKDSHTLKKKDIKDTDKKIEKKERKRKEKAMIREQKSSSLSNLIGMKVAHMANSTTPIKSTVISDNCYDNQVNASINAILSDETETDVLFDGLFCMDEMKSPESTQDKNERMSVMRHSDSNIENGANSRVAAKIVTGRVSTPTFSRASTGSPQPKISEEVKNSITKLIHFRRQKASSESPEPKYLLPNQNLQTHNNNIIKTQNAQQVNDRKINIDKSQSEKLAALQNELSNLLNNRCFTPRPSILRNPSPKVNNIPSTVKTLNSALDKSNIPKPSTSKDFIASPNTLDMLNKQNSNAWNEHLAHRSLDGHQKNFQEFLKELQATINAGAGHEVNAQPNDEVIPISRVNPVLPKAETKVTHSAKQPVKKLEVAPNTFSRLSYYKNNQNNIKTKQFVNAIMEHQSQQLEKRKIEDLDRVIAEHKTAKVQYLNSSGETIIKPTKPTDNTLNIVRKSSSKSRENLSLTDLLNSSPNLVKTPVNQSIQNKQRDMRMPTLTKKDEEIVRLIKQQGKQTLNRLKSETSKCKVPTQTNTSINSNFSNLVNKKVIDSKSVIVKNPGVVKSTSSAKLSNEVKSGTKPIIVKNEVVCIKNNDTGLQKIKVNKSESRNNQSKASAKQQETVKQTDWESVMDALLKHKTPSRGPNALDMALNKDTYLSAYESSLCNPCIFTTPSELAGEQEGILMPSQHEVDKSPKVDKNTKILKQPNTYVIKDTKSKSIQSPKYQNHVASPVLEGHTSIPKQHLDQHSKVDKPKTLISDCKPRETTTGPKKLNTELKKQQFTCTLPKEDDPFISGNMNSDYDLLEELIDDDLRQEIGELLSDEDCYNAPPSLKDLKSFIEANKPVTPVTKNMHCVEPPLVNSSNNNSYLKTLSQSLPCPSVTKPVINTNLTLHPTGYINMNANQAEQPKTQNISSIQTTNVVHQIPKSVIVSPKEQNYVNPVPTVDRTFVAVPQQTALQNVVLIGSELVYQPCIRPLNTGIAQNTYVTFNTQPNIAVYQTTQFAAPVVNPCIIGNAITTPTVPVGVSTNKMSHSVPTTASKLNAPKIIGGGIKNEIKNCDARGTSAVAVVNKVSVNTVTHDHNGTKEKFDSAVPNVPHSSQIQAPRHNEPSIIDKGINIKYKKGDFKINDKLVDIDNKMSVKTVIQDDSIGVSAVNIPHLTITKISRVEEEEAPPIIDEVGKNEFKKCNAMEMSNGEVNNKISVSTIIQDDTAPKENDDINISGERKVLSEVQENYKLTEIPDPKNMRTREQRISFEQHDVKKISEHVRLNNKRKAILNRNIYHRSNNSPIALTYAPLKTKKCVLTKTHENHRNLRNTAKLPNATNEPDRNLESLLNIQIVEPQPDKNKEKNSNENSKENENRTCRRTSLRSSNKLYCDKTKKSISVDAANEDTKLELESPSTETVKSTTEVKNKIAFKKRAVKKTLNKTIKKVIIKKRITRQSSKISNANSVTEQKQNEDMDIKQKTAAEAAQKIDGFMDIEDQIIGSMILKKVSSEPVFVNVESVDMVVNTPNNDDSCNPIENLSPKPILPNLQEDISNESNADTNITEKTEFIESKNNTQTDSNNEETINSHVNEYTELLDSQFEDNSVHTNFKFSDTKLNNMKQSSNLQKDININKPLTLNELATATEIKEKSITKDTTTVISKSTEKSTAPNSAVTKVKLKNAFGNNADGLHLDSETGKTNKDNRPVSPNPADAVPQSFIDAIKIEEMQNFDPNDPLKKCVRIKLPNGRAFKATVRGQSLVNIETLFRDPALKKVLLSNISSNNRYTLNIKQISMSNKVEPDKILETRIQKIFLQPPKPVANGQQVHCMETINLLSDEDDDDDQTLHSFNTEFGKYKILVMKKELHEIHQKTFDKKCIVKLKKITLQQSVASSLSDNVREPETEVILSDVINADTNPIPIALTKVIDQVSEEKNDFNEKPLNQGIIEIDDSSDDDLNLNYKNNETKTCEEKIQEFKNLLLKDLGVEETDDHVNTSVITIQEKVKQLTRPDTISMLNEEKLEELIVPNIGTTELSTCNTLVSDETSEKSKPLSPMSDKSCYVTLTKCDDLVEKYNSLKLIKECSINLVRCDDIQHDDSSSISFDLENSCEELRMTSSPSLLRSESFSILNEFDQFDQLLPSDDLMRSTSPVMAAYEILAALRISNTDNQPKISNEWKCDTEWFLSKHLLWLQNKSTNITKRNWNSKTENDNVNDINIFDHGYNSSTHIDTTVCEEQIVQVDVPSLFTIVTKYFQDFGIVHMRRYIHTPISSLKSSYNLKRKSLCSVTTDGRISKRCRPVPSVPTTFSDVEKSENNQVIVDNEASDSMSINKFEHLVLEFDTKETELTIGKLSHRNDIQRSQCKHCEKIVADDNVAKHTSSVINTELVFEEKPSITSEEIIQVKTTEAVNVKDFTIHEVIMNDDSNNTSLISNISTNSDNLNGVSNETVVLNKTVLPNCNVTEESQTNDDSVSKNPTNDPVLLCDEDTVITTDAERSYKSDDINLNERTTMSNTSDRQCGVNNIINTDVDVMNEKLSNNIEWRNMTVSKVENNKAVPNNMDLQTELLQNTFSTCRPKDFISHIDSHLNKNISPTCNDTPVVQRSNTKISILQKHEISYTSVSKMLHEPYCSNTPQDLQNSNVTGMLINEDDKYVKSPTEVFLDTTNPNKMRENSYNYFVSTSNCNMQNECENKINEIKDLNHHCDMSKYKTINDNVVITNRLITQKADLSPIKPVPGINPVDQFKASPTVELISDVDEKEECFEYVGASVPTEIKLKEIGSLSEASDNVISSSYDYTIQDTGLNTKQIAISDGDINIKDDILVDVSSKSGVICNSTDKNAKNNTSMTEVSDERNMENVGDQSCMLNEVKTIASANSNSDATKPCEGIQQKYSKFQANTIRSENCNDGLPQNLLETNTDRHSDKILKEEVVPVVPNHTTFHESLDEKPESIKDTFKLHSISIIDTENVQTKLKNNEPSLKENGHRNKTIPMLLSESYVKINVVESNSNNNERIEEKLVQRDFCSNDSESTSKTTRNDLLQMLADESYTTVSSNTFTEHESNKIEPSISLCRAVNDSLINDNDNNININSIILSDRCSFLQDGQNDLVEDIVELQGNDELEQELARIVLGSANGDDNDKQILIINADNLEFDEVKVCCIQQSELQKLINMENNDKSDKINDDYESSSKEPTNLFLDDDDDFSQSSEDILQVTQELDEYGNVKEIDIRLNVPKVTYSRKDIANSFHLLSDKKSKRGLKRKGDMAEVKAPEKKYRKGKNIDTPKLTAVTIAETAYSKEFKRLFDYCSTVKFSYSRPFHKDHIDVHQMLRSWPVAEACNSKTDSHIDVNLFIEAENVEERDPMNQTLAEEIQTKYSETDYCLCPVMENNFQMGFGERSGRVIQNLEDNDEKFSAATLSDVKQTQPLLLSENFSNCDSIIDVNNIDTGKHEIGSFQRTYECIQLKDKIRSFFKKTMVELNNDWIKQNNKYDVDKNEYKFDKSSFPFGLNHLDFINPPSVEVVIQVVQVGQLPVSTAAQNPVTCDPRVTQVSDASPSQCTPENSPNDDSQSPIKTEYTELTTADINLPLQEYAQHHSQLLAENQNSSNIIMHDFIIEEIKEEIKEEIDEPEVSDEANDNFHVARPNNQFSPSLNCIIDNVDYTYDGASPTQPITSIAEDNAEMGYKQAESDQQQYHDMKLHNKNQSMENLHQCLRNEHDDVTQHSSDNASHFIQHQDQPLILPQSPQTEIGHQSQQLQIPREKMSDINHSECIEKHNLSEALKTQQKNVTSQVDQQQIVQSQQTHIVQHNNQTQIIQQHLQAFVAQPNNETQVAQHNPQAHVVQQNQPVQIMHQNIQGHISQQIQQGQIPQQDQQMLQQQHPSTQQTVLSHVAQVKLSQQNLQMHLPQHTDQKSNRSPEKIDQIAHAMNAAGISTSSESLGHTRAHALVNILSQKLQGSAGSSPTNSHSKTAQINAMALQQALAQLLPPPLNQTNIDNQSSSSSTPQVLHIVQGKNASGNQITLIDNSQSSVINTPNATPVLHIVQNKGNVSGPTSNGPAPQSNSFSGLSLVDAGLQQGNQLLHIVNTGNQKNANTGQLLRKVNLLTNLTNVQGSNEQKMVQFVCKSADGKSIQLNSPHPRGMVLRLQPVESPNIPLTQTKSMESQELSPPSSTPNNIQNKESGTSQQEIKSRSIYEENYAKFIQSSNKTAPEKATSLPKFGQAFGKQVFQEGSQKADMNNSNTHLQPSSEHPDCQANDNAVSLEPPLLLRKSPQTTQAQPNLVQQLKQTIAPMSMHGGVIYTRQIPVNIGGGQTINLITVPSTDLIDDSTPKQSANQEGIEPSIIKIVPQTSASNSETSDETNSHIGNDNSHTPQTQPLTQMRIKLPMLSKNPQVVGGTRLMRPSFFHIQRNVIGGANQPMYQQLVFTAAPPLGQQTIRLPQTQTNRHVKVPSESQSSSESQMSSSTLEQLREFDLVLEQVKERSTGTGTTQPNATPSPSSSFSKVNTSSTDTTDSSPPANSSASSITQQVLYSICNNKQLNVAYVNRKTPVTTTTTSSYVRSPDSSSGIVETPSSSSHIRRTVSSESSTTETSRSHNNHSSHSSHTNHTAQHPKSSKVRPRPRPKAPSNPPNTLKLPTAPPKTSTQKPAEDEQTTQRILYILAEYKEQVENSPDKDKPAPRRRTNLPCNPGGSSKRKKSSSGSRRRDDMSPCHGEDTSRTMGSEDSSCGTSQGDCNESCIDSHSPQDSPRKVVRKLTFEQETAAPIPQPQPSRNVIVADGQTITVARGATGKPTTAVLMPTNYILPVSMVKGSQQIAIVTNRGPKLLTVGGGEGGATNALLLQRLIGPAGLKPVLTRPGVRHVRLPTAALHNLQTFNLTTATTVQPPDSTVSPAPVPTPDLVDTRATSSPWRTERESREGKPERGSSPEGSEPWNLPSSDYSYEETVRSEQMDRTVLDPIPDRYSPDMEAQRIFDKMFDVDSKKSYMVDSHDDSPRCGYDIDASDCDDKVYHQVVHKKDGSSHRQHRLTHVSAAALRHKYAILEHELRLQKSLSEECEDLGVDSPSASELFPEAELLFAASPAHDHTQDVQAHHSHTPQPMLTQSGIPQPDLDDQIATDQLLQRDHTHDDRELTLGLEDVGIVTVSEDGMQATIQLDQEEFARSHPNTTFHSEPTEEGEVQHSFTLSSLKSRHITSTILHSNRPQGTVLMAAPQTTVISQATAETGGVHHNTIKYSDIDNMINCLPSTHSNNINLNSVFVKDDGLSRFDSLLQDSRELHLSNATPAIRHSSAHATQVIRRVYDDKRQRDGRFLIDEPEGIIAGDDANMRGEDSSRDATLESMGDTTGSSPERHADLFWDSASARVDYSSDSEKCCKSPLDDNSVDSSPGVGVRAHVRLDSVIKEARGHISDDDVPPLRTYPAPRSLSGKTAPSGSAGNGRRRASGRGLVKRGSCLCCVGDAPSKPKKPRVRRPALDFAAAN